MAISPYQKSGNQDSAPLEEQEKLSHPGQTVEASGKQTSRSADELASAEQSAGQAGEQLDSDSSEAPGDSLYAPNSGHDNQVGRGYRRISKGALNEAANPKSWLRGNRRKFFIFGGAGLAILLPVIFFLAIFLPSLKLPQLAAELEGYRLARLSRTFYNNATLLTADKSYLDATGETTAGDLAGKTPLGKALSLYKPARVVNNMKATGVLDFEYSNNKLSSVILNGEKISVPDYKYKSLSDLKRNYSERIRFAAQIQAGVNEALDGSNYFVRSATAKKILSAYGITLQWWEKLGSQYKNLSEQEADRLALRQTEQQINTPDSESLKTAGLQDAVNSAEKAQAACLQNDACTDQEIATNGLAPEVTKAIEDGTKISTASKFLNIVNPLYSAAFPVCIAYDGSADISKQFLNSQNAAAMKTFFAVASASDQQKSGDTTSEAVGAFNRRVGDITSSYIGQITNGASNVDTSADISPQAGRSGEFTVFNAIFGGGTIAGAANKVANAACPVATNTWVAAGTAVGNVLALFIPGPDVAVLEGDAAAATAEAESTSLIGAIAARVVSQVTSTEGRAAIKNTAKDYASSSVKSSATSEGLTYLSRMIVLSEMGAFINGMDSQDFANQADMGAIAYNNQMIQQQQFGRPLTQSETAGVEKEDTAYVGQENQSQSSFYRNLAVTNPYSPVGKIAMAMSSWKLSSIASLFTNLPHMIGSIFSPTHVFGHAAAAGNVNSDYHMVQFGWSTDEEHLIKTDASYDPIINAEIVNDPANATNIQQISSTYGKCFTDDIGTLLTSDGLNRDSNGNVQDSTKAGDCSPSNLSFNSPDPIAIDASSQTQHRQDLIFRWRLDQAYQSTQNELNGVQQPSSSPGGPTTNPQSCGDSQQPDWARSCSQNNPVVATDWYCNKQTGTQAAPQFKCPSDFAANIQTSGQHQGAMLFNYTANGNRTRQAMLYVPQKNIQQYENSPTQQTDSTPLVIYLHGRGLDTSSGPGWYSTYGYWPVRPGDPRKSGSPANIDKMTTMANKYNAIVVDPQGQGRVLGDPSYGWSGQIDDLTKLPGEIQQMFPWLNIDLSRVYVMGSSMGGQEALELTAQHPELIAAAYVNDPVTDLAAQHDSLLQTYDSMVVPTAMEPEVGGTPANNKNAYAARSPITMIPPANPSNADILNKPIRLDIDTDDTIVPLSQKMNFYNDIKNANSSAPIFKYTCPLEHAYILAVTANGYDNAFSFFNNSGNWLTNGGNQTIAKGSIDCSK